MTPRDRVNDDCAYCDGVVERDADGHALYAIHRDGFGVGPEVDLCVACGSGDKPTSADIWDRIAQPSAKDKEKGSMMDIVLKLSDAVPESEFSAKFAQGMLDRMSTSFFKYGRVAEGYPLRVDAVASLKLRLDKYLADGNTEHLMDVANFAMIEFMHPRNPHAHFRATDSCESAGRVWHGEVDPSRRGNSPDSWTD